jgi:hypothetical protein
MQNPKKVKEFTAILQIHLSGLQSTKATEKVGQVRDAIYNSVTPVFGKQMSLSADCFKAYVKIRPDIEKNRAALTAYKST